MAYATVTDVQTRLGRAISDTAEIAQVTAWIDDVEAIIKARIPDLDARITDGWISNATVVRVQCQAVIRKIKNPDGVTYEAIDDHRQGYNEAMARGELHLTEDEWGALLASPEAPGSEGAFTIWPYNTSLAS